MVPEINLTPQLEQRFTERFAPQYGADCVVSMHSAMTNPQRLKSWLAAHTGVARIVLGTRMSVFASLPGLSLIVVDEEHDASYKQQEGARYSARDLAIWRARDTGAKVILGSATPSLESWHASRPPNADEPQGGRYLRLHMPSRIGAAALPRVRLVDMGQQPRKAVFSPPLIDAITERVQRGEQSLVLLNRRGFAPVLFCADCGWKSDCPHCSAHQVFHKADRTLRCHHCGYTQRVPMACPGCGNPDILPLGKGTEQLEEELARLLRNVQRPDREPARVARIDADTTRAKGALEEQLAQVHAGDIDVLVGTQMVAKGHDFRRITLVAAVQPDSALFSSDYRAPERLFSLLMQAAGRAGRDAHYVAAQGSHPEMWIQTHDPSHPVYTALRSHDYPAFAARQLRERRDAGMPPFAFQAIVAGRCAHAGSRPGLPGRCGRGRPPGRPAPCGRCLSLSAHSHVRAARGQCGARADADRVDPAARPAALSLGLAGAPALDQGTARAPRPGALAGGRGPAGHLSVARPLERPQKTSSLSGLGRNPAKRSPLLFRKRF